MIRPLSHGDPRPEGTGRPGAPGGYGEQGGYGAQGDYGAQGGYGAQGEYGAPVGYDVSGGFEPSGAPPDDPDAYAGVDWEAMEAAEARGTPGPGDEAPTPDRAAPGPVAAPANGRDATVKFDAIGRRGAGNPAAPSNGRSMAAPVSGAAPGLRGLLPFSGADAYRGGGTVGRVSSQGAVVPDGRAQAAGQGGLGLNGVAAPNGRGGLGSNGVSGSTGADGSDGRKGGKLYLKVNHLKQRDAAVKILRRTPGDIPVLFYHADECKTYAAPRELWVGIGVDLMALKVLLGGDRVVMK